MTSTALDRIVVALESAGRQVTRQGGTKALAQCPAHDDGRPSLSLTQIHGQALIHCFAGCQAEDIMAALNLTTRDLFDEPRGVRYDYTDATGTVTRTVTRTPDKKFHQRGQTKGATSTLYRLPELVAAVAAGRAVYVVEGEKDADALVSVGAAATTAPMGASNWHLVDPSPLTGADVVVIVDRDDAGRKWAHAVRDSLASITRSLTFREAAEGKDAADHIAAGYGPDNLLPVELDPEAGGADDDEPGSTWRPLDLSATVAGLLDGSLERVTPTVGKRDDGMALLYPGRVNGIAGQSGSGKSWTALAICAQEIAAGEHVAFIDMEDDQAGIVSRLLDLGVTAGAILERFHYVQPAEGYGLLAREALAGALADIRPSLIVVDSTGEAMSLDNVKPNDDDEVARWFRRLPRALARATGAAVLVLDHVVKADDGGLWPIGSHRKRAAVSGLQLMQVTVKPFAKDAAGMAKLVCAKDRGGNFRAGQKVAEVHVTPSAETLLTLRAPHEGEPGGPVGDWRPTGIMERISTALAAQGEPMSFRRIDERVSGKAEHKRTALRCLIDAGHVTVTTGPRNAQLHTLVRRYDQRADPRSDLYRGPGHTQPSDDRVTVSVSLERDTGHTHSTVSGTHSGHGGDTVESGPTCPRCGDPLDDDGRCRIACEAMAG